MNKRILISVFILLLGIGVNAQNIIWQKTYGGSQNDSGFRNMLKTSDGGYIVASNSKSNNGDVSGNHGEYDVWLVKLDQNMNIQWQKCFGGNKDEYSNKIIIDSDGNYIIMGQTISNNGDVSGFHNGGNPSNNYNDIWITKISSTGALLWQKCLGGSYYDNYVDMYLLNDGNIMLFSTSNSSDGDVTDNHGGNDYWVVKLTPNGIIDWKKSYGGSSDDSLRTVILLDNGNFLLAGDTMSSNGDVNNNHGSNDIWIIKIDTNGNLISQKTYGGSQSEGLNTIIKTTDSGYIISGYSSSTDGDVNGNNGNLDYWIVKIDNSGNIEWQNNYGGSQNDWMPKIQQTNDGGYIVYGYTSSTDGDVSGFHGSNDTWVLKLDAIGNIEWQKCLGGSSYDVLYMLKKINNNFLFIGITRSNDGDVSGFHFGGQYNNGGDYYDDVWVVKLSATGNILWQKCLGGGGIDSANNLYTDYLDGYLLAMSTKSNDGDVINNHGARDAWLVELNKDYPYFEKTEFYQNVTPNPSNPNNYLNQGLPIRFKVKVKNELAQNLSTLTGTLTCSTSGVTITDNSVSFGNLGSGLSIWSDDEFEITVDPNVANGTNLEFQLSLNDVVVSGGPWTSDFAFPIAPLQNGNIVLVDQNGNGDSNPDPGEHIKLFPKIDNISGSTMTQVSGTLSSDDSFLNITSNNWRYNWVSNVHQPINPGDTDIMPEYPFEFDYPASEPLQELNFNLEIQGNLNDSNGPLLKWQTHFSFNDGIEPPPTIVTTTPADDTVDVPIDTDLQIVFDKNVMAVSGKYIHLYKDGGTVVANIQVTDTQVSINGSTVDIDLTSDLDGATDYFVTIDPGAFKDNTNNDFAGITTPNIWNFTTIHNNPPDAPVLTATAISDTEIELSWNVVNDADNYQVFSCDGTITYNNNVTATTYTVSGLIESTLYDFMVKAQNAVGLSNPSNCASATTFCNSTWGSVTHYTNQMVTAYGIVTIDGNPAEAGDKVGAFAGSELRGIGNIVVNNNTAYTTLTINNNGTQETYSFVIWDQSQCQDVPVSLTVQAAGGQTLGLPPNYLNIAGSTTSIAENSGIDKLVNIYPNPTENILHITADENIKHISITNNLGQKIYDKNVNSKQLQISLAPFAKGTYFIKADSAGGSVVKVIFKK